MTLTQTVEITDNRRLHLDFEVPRDVPAGKARIELKVIPFIKTEENSTITKPLKLYLTQKELDEMLQNAQTPVSDSLSGILAHLGDITIEQIREERLTKY